MTRPWITDGASNRGDLHEAINALPTDRSANECRRSLPRGLTRRAITLLRLTSVTLRLINGDLETQEIASEPLRSFIIDDGGRSEGMRDRCNIGFKLLKNTFFYGKKGGRGKKRRKEKAGFLYASDVDRWLKMIWWTSMTRLGNSLSKFMRDYVCVLPRLERRTTDNDNFRAISSL